MKRKKDAVPKTRRILLVLELTLQSGREHLAGFYRYADTKKNWRVQLIPSIDATQVPAVKEMLAAGIDGAVIKGEFLSTLPDRTEGLDCPIVAIDRPPASCVRAPDVFICNENDRIGREALRYFESLGSFAAYGYVPAKGTYEWSRARGAAFRREAESRHPNAAFSRAGDDLAGWIRDLPKPAAVFAAYDRRAAEVLDACWEQSVNVPGDVLVLGVDDDTLVCEHTKPKLSSIQPDNEGQGFAAAQALDRLLSGRRGSSRDRIVCPHSGISVRDSTTILPPALHLVRRISAYLDGHALKDISVSDVIKHVGVSQRLANLRFRQIRKRSIREEIVLRRLAEAKRLLRSSDMDMKRIARRCGFRSQTVLAHLFRKRFGMSMSAWRNST